MSEKKSTYKVIGEEEEPRLYALMRELVAEHHEDLQEARIALVWRNNWKPDPDGRLDLGQCRKAAELDRMLHNFDLIILLNQEVWTSVAFTDAQKRALLDHELCHGALATDSDGFPKYTADGRRQYRIRKHTIEEFHEIVDRHGIWKGDIQSFVERAMAAGTPAQLTIEDQEVVGHVLDKMMDAVEDPDSIEDPGKPDGSRRSATLKPN